MLHYSQNNGKQTKSAHTQESHSHRRPNLTTHTGYPGQRSGNGCLREMEAVKWQEGPSGNANTTSLQSRGSNVTLCVPQIPALLPFWLCWGWSPGLGQAVSLSYNQPRFLSMFKFLDFKNKSFWTFSLSSVEHTGADAESAGRKDSCICISCVPEIWPRC